MYGRVHRAISELSAVTEDVIATGDRVVTRHTATATQAGVPGPARHLRWSIINIYRVAGGRIAERWGPVHLGLNLAETTARTHAPAEPT
jgi:predicted ester cyclase